MKFNKITADNILSIFIVIFVFIFILIAINNIMKEIKINKLENKLEKHNDIDKLENQFSFIFGRMYTHKIYKESNSFETEQDYNGEKFLFEDIGNQLKLTYEKYNCSEEKINDLKDNIAYIIK